MNVKIAFSLMLGANCGVDKYLEVYWNFFFT